MSHRRHYKPKKDKPVRSMGVIEPEPVLAEVRNRAIEHAPDVIIHAERVTELQPSRGETLRPVVHGGYQHSFQSYSHTIWGGKKA
jgi:hypothetical protein